ncbi:hypothetical protein C0993_009063 [Termitomyces sp. T159_Od127]|nr:hypothetical protein C0993_009063 [Termitomyces sp. T159_Od127]
MPLARRLSTRAPAAAHVPDHPVHASSTITIVRAADAPRRAPHRPVSFAASCFGPASPPRARPSSPHRPAPPLPHLSPDQLVSLARSATAHPPPATAFTPLPDDILLPFIDRPAEVAALIATPPSAKLFSLLEKTLAPLTEPASDPARWTYAQLHTHLTRVSRQQAPDPIWVLAARRCIISHSELIWERVKGALGVPPELDLECDDEYDSHSSIDTDEISDDHGRSARGHWDDWDAIMDSPVYARRHSGPGSPILPLSLSDDHFLSIEPLLASTDSGPALDDIQESAEEDEEQSAAHDPHLIAPSRIQGLRITTTPTPLSPVLPPSASQPLSPISPLPPYVYPAPRSRPPSGTFTRPSVPRSGSAGSLASLRGGYAADHEDGYASSDAGTKSPLFPSSFAMLSPEPTLVHR